MVVETNLHLGKGIVRGNQFSLRRVIPGVPSGATVEAAYLTLKDAYTTLDASATISKEISSTHTADVGQIESNGSGGVAKLRFDLTSADTLAMVAEVKYYFDIMVRLDSGDEITFERGITSSKERVTQA